MASSLEVKKNPDAKNMLNMLFSTKKSYDIPVEKDIFASDSEEEEKTCEMAAIPLKLSFGSENDSSLIQSNKVDEIQSDFDQTNQSGDGSHSNYNLSGTSSKKECSFVASESSLLLDKGNSMDEITKGLETCLLEKYENDDETDEDVEKSYLGRHQVTILHSSESDLCDTNKKVMEEIELKCMEIPKKPIRKRIVMMSSTDSESEKESENENDCNASFDIGAIKRKFATPAHRVASRSSISDKNDYDFEDSFINDNEDQSESDFTHDEELDEDYEDDEENLEDPVTPDVISKTKPKTKEPKSKTKETNDFEDSFINDGDDQSESDFDFELEEEDEDDKENVEDPETPEVISKPKPKTKETKPKPKPKAKETKPKTKEIQPNTKKTQPKTNDTKLKTITTKTLLASLSDVKVESTTHPSAFKYIQNFNKHKEELSDFLYRLYNSEIFDGCMPYDMKLVWSKTLNKTAGTCHMKRKGQDRFCEIHLAVKVLTSADRLRDTLIHEMCHAASWILNDIRDGHGPVFKSWGKCAVNAFPELPLITRCHNYVINYKFAFICQDCNHQYKRHSKSINPEKQRCGKCAKNGKFFDKNSNAGKLVLHTHDKKSGKYVPHHTTGMETPARQPNAFAAFVKDNYKFHRTPGVSHTDAMKELSKEFAKNKI